MALKVPNYDQATYPAQAAPDTSDIGAMVAGHGGSGVIGGCAVVQHAAGANMTVDVAQGGVMLAGVGAGVTAASVTITTADATNPRIDLVVSDSAGALTVIAGTAAASPEAPESFDPASKITLAAVYVPAGATAITTAMITDKRVMIGRPGLLLGSKPFGSGSYTTTSTTLADVDATNLTITFTTGPSGNVVLSASLLINTASGNNSALGWRNGSTSVSGHVISTNTLGLRIVDRQLVALTPNTTYTLKLAWATTGGATMTIFSSSTDGGTTNGRILLEAYAA